MRFSKVTRILVASAAATAISVSGASAVEIAGNAVADGAERVAPVTIRSVAAATITTIRASRITVVKGRRVKIAGSVTSTTAPECQGLNSSAPGVGMVQIKAGSKTVSVSLNNGTYKKSFKIKKKTFFQATFMGAAFGVHPNDVSCFSSPSAKLRIRVKR